MESTKQSSRRGQFLRFCVNGCLAVGIQYGAYWLFLHWLDVNLAFALGYLVSFACNFLVTSYWTFRSSPSLARLAGFCLSHGVNFLVQMGVLNLLLWMGVPKEVAAILAIAAAVPVNFALLRIVYRRR